MEGQKGAEAENNNDLAQGFHNLLNLNHNLTLSHIIFSITTFTFTLMCYEHSFAETDVRSADDFVREDVSPCSNWNYRNDESTDGSE